MSRADELLRHARELETENARLLEALDVAEDRIKLGNEQYEKTKRERDASRFLMAEARDDFHGRVVLFSAKFLEMCRDEDDDG